MFSKAVHLLIRAYGIRYNISSITLLMEKCHRRQLKISRGERFGSMGILSHVENAAYAVHIYVERESIHTIMM